MTSDLKPYDGLPRRPALAAGIAAVVGSAVAAINPVEGPWPLVAVIGGAVLMAGAFAASRWGRVASLLGVLAVALAFVGYGVFRATPAADSLAARYPDGAELVRLRGVIVEGGDYLKRDPAAFEYPEQPAPIHGFPVGADPRRGVSYLLEVHSLPDLGVSASGAVKLYLPPETRLPLLSEVELLGRLRTPRRAGNEGEVDSARRYALRGVTHTMTVDDARAVTIIGDAGGWAWPARVHEFFHGAVGSRIERANAAVLGAALLGERGTLSASQRTHFVQSGTVHLLVVSGMHVALLAAAIVLALRIFGVDLRWCWAVAGLAALAYFFVTGIQPSTLRATLMVLIYALGHMVERKPDTLNVLGASALLSLAFDPMQVAEIGFALSYLAVLGIVAVAPALRVFEPRPPRTASRALLRWLGASLRISLGVGLCTWPLLALFMHMLSPVMLVSNLVAGPLVSVILILGLALPLALIPGVGGVLAWVMGLLAGLLEWLSRLFASIPFGHIYVAAPPVWWLVGDYALLIAALVAPRLRLPRVAGAAAWSLWLCLLPATALVSNEPPGPLRLTALDVGQGICAVAEVPGGPTVVIDCGSTSLGSPGERVLAPYLWSRGRKRIDVLAVSHADADHVNGLPQLFERFAVGTVLVGESLADDDTGRALQAWLAARTRVMVFKRGDSFEISPGVSLRCLWPDRAYVGAMIPEGERRNNAGMVLELAAGPRRVLLPADVENSGLAPILNQLVQPDILLAPHQGSAVEGLKGLLERLSPQHIVISARETFPDEGALETYAAAPGKLWRTYDQGAITFLIGADGKIEARPFIQRQ
ncbi:MAG: ComEC/Rec2 family competence protein [Planctomycetes bacterium]|nr:ComEC/Rec2 family competence protein [Planctomycetota bacterium]